MNTLGTHGGQEMRIDLNDGWPASLDSTYQDWKDREKKYREQFTDERWIRNVQRPTVEWMEEQIGRGHELSGKNLQNEWQKSNAKMMRANCRLELCKTDQCGRRKRLDALIGRADG